MLVKWLQNQHLVQAAEMGIRSYIDGVDDQSELRILKARQYMIGNDMKHAKSEAEMVFEEKKTGPLRAEAASVLANIQRKLSENRDEEIRLLEIATTQMTDDGEAKIGASIDMHRLLKSRLRLGRMKLFSVSRDAQEEAEKIFREITERRPHFTMCKILRAQALIRLRDIESAESILRDVMEKNSQCPEVYAAMAYLSLCSRPVQVKTAAQFARIAIRRGIQDISIMLLLSETFAKENDDDTAKILLRHIMSNDKIYSKEAIALWKEIKMKLKNRNEAK